MGYLGYDKIAVKGIAGLKHIEQMELDITPNQHAKLKVKGLLRSESGTAYLEENLEGRTIQLVTTEVAEKTIFAGKICVAHLMENREVFDFAVEAFSGTMLLDQEKHSRSFQNINLTYPQVIKQVLKDVPHGMANYQVGQDKKIGVPLIQHLEKDWDYIKRMASHFSAVVVPEVTSGWPRFWFGMPCGTNHTLNQVAEYQIRKDFSRFNEMGGASAGYQVDDFLGCEVRTGEEFDIGDRVSFQDRVWTVGSKKGRIEKGLWVYTYGLGFKPAFGLKKRYNKLISGMSIQGKVLETKGERLKVHLDIDPTQDQGTAYWYPWAPTSGNMMYCMPQVGTQVVLYFPDEYEEHARITGCVRTNGAQCQDTGDPNNRYFTTEHHKQLAMLPAEFSFSGVGDEQKLLKITMAEKPVNGFTGISFKSHKLLVLHAKGNITLSSDKQITCKVKTEICVSNNNDEATLHIKYGFDVNGRRLLIEAEDHEQFPALKDGFNWGKFAFNVAIATLAIFAFAAAMAIYATPALVFVGAAVAGSAVTSGAVFSASLITGAVVAGFKATSDLITGHNSTPQDYVAKAICGTVGGSLGAVSFGAVGALSWPILAKELGWNLGAAFVGKLAAHAYSMVSPPGEESYGVSDYASEEIGAAFGFGIFKSITTIVARKTVGAAVNKMSGAQIKGTIRDTMKKFDDLSQQPGGGKKWMATYNKAGKTGNMDLIREFTPEVADRTSLAGVQQGLRNNSINQLKKLAIAKPDLFREAAYQSMHSNFTKIYFPSTTGGMLGEEASNVADDWLSNDDSENKEVSVTKEELPYVVRGAALKCSCGTQKRQINLPEGHGVYITGEPVICEKDCQALQHIMEFRVCKLHKLCKPDLAAQWKNPQNDVSVNGDKIITTKSTLICKKGGIISLENSGQKIQ